MKTHCKECNMTPGGMGGHLSVGADRSAARAAKVEARRRLERAVVRAAIQEARRPHCCRYKAMVEAVGRLLARFPQRDYR